MVEDWPASVEEKPRVVTFDQYRQFHASMVAQHVGPKLLQTSLQCGIHFHTALGTYSACVFRELILK